MQLSGSLEILALTVPTQTNEYTAVSMYYNQNAAAVNERASALAHACGHKKAVIKGDAFVSRIIDNEVADVWKRIDIDLCELDPRAEWVLHAQKLHKGGGSGASLSGTMAQLGGQFGG